MIKLLIFLEQSNLRELKLETNFITVNPNFISIKLLKKKKGKEDKFINLVSRFRTWQTSPEKEREERAWKTGSNGLPCGFGYRRVF